jgi:hypothetical protein
MIVPLAVALRIEHVALGIMIEDVELPLVPEDLADHVVSGLGEDPAPLQDFAPGREHRLQGLARQVVEPGGGGFADGFRQRQRGISLMTGSKIKRIGSARAVV